PTPCVSAARLAADTTRATYGSASRSADGDPTATTTRSPWPLASARAPGCGTYPRCSTAASTARRASAETGPVPRTTRDAVDRETRAAAATSSSVTVGMDAPWAGPVGGDGRRPRTHANPRDHRCGSVPTRVVRRLVPARERGLGDAHARGRVPVRRPVPARGEAERDEREPGADQRADRVGEPVVRVARPPERRDERLERRDERGRDEAAEQRGEGAPQRDRGEEHGRHEQHDVRRELDPARGRQRPLDRAHRE